MLKIDLDVVIDSPGNDIDMQYGLETLKGTSDVIGIVAESILRERVPDRRTHKSDVRTKLKQSFVGSYGQRFSIEVNDEKLKRRLKKIGNDTFLEVLIYFVMEALYLDVDNLSEEAAEIVEQLSNISDKLVNRLKEPLIEMHKIPNYFNYDVKIRQRKRGLPEPKQLLLLDKGTAINITESVISDTDEDIEVVVVRFHSITGNGRFYIKDLEKIESFGFYTKMKTVKNKIRKSISSNLHNNNTVRPEDGDFIKVRVRKVSLPGGKLIKYLIVGVYV